MAFHSYQSVLLWAGIMTIGGYNLDDALLNDRIKGKYVILNYCLIKRDIYELTI